MFKHFDQIDRYSDCLGEADDGHRPVLVSAVTGEGTDALIAMIAATFARSRVTLDVALDLADGAGMSWLHRHAEVLARDEGADGRMHMTVRVAPDRAGIVRAKFGSENIRAAGIGTPL